MPNERRVRADFVFGATDAALAAPGYSPTVLADSPLLYWRLGEASGTVAADASPNARPGTYEGTTALGTAGLLTGDTNTAVTMSGDDRVSRAHEAALDATSFTAEAVIKPSSITGNQTVLARYHAAGTTSWTFRIDAGVVKLYTWVAGAVEAVSSTTTLAAGTTYHLAGSYDGTNLRVYVNGNLEATLARGAFDASTATLTAGNKGHTADEGFSGVLDEVAFYGAALSGARITAHSQAVTGGGSSDMSSPGLSKLPVIDTTSHAVLTLSDASNYEIVRVVSHASGATTATIQRGQEGSTGRSWPSGTTWQHGPTVGDFPTITPDASWQTLTLANGWVNFGAPFAPASYRKFSNGTVAVRGLVMSGTTTAGTVLATLPAGYRPAANQIFNTLSSTGSCRIDAEAGGNLVLGAGASATFTALDDIHFLAER